MGDIKYNLRTPSDMFWGAYKVKVAFYGDIHLYPHIEVYDAIATYNVTSTGDTKIFGSLEAIEKMYIDEVERTPNTVFKFKTSGEHIIKIIFKENATSFNRLFDDCARLTRFELNGYSTSHITDLGHLFTNCENLEYVSELDCTNAEDLSYIFNNCKIQTLPIVNITNKCKYLRQTLSLIPLITEIDVSAWDVSNVTDMSGLFAYSDKLQKINISNWTIQANADTESMFENTPALSLVMCNDINCEIKGIIEQQLEADGHTNVTITSNVNCGGGEVNPDDYDIILEYNTERGSTMKFKVNGIERTATTTPYYATLADWGLNSAEEITSYSFDTSNLSKVVKLPFTSSIKSTYFMFNQCQDLTEVDMIGWDLSGVDNAGTMFGYCENLTEIKTDFNFESKFKPKSTWGMFGGCKSLVNIPYVNLEEANEVKYMFYDCRSAKKIILPSQMIYVQTTESMFQDCFELEEIESIVGGDVAFGANWQDGTNNRWTNAQQMFYNCQKLTRLPFGNYISAFYYLQNVVGMFANCKSLTEINLYSKNNDGWSDLSLVASCFLGCENVRMLDLSPWSYSTQNLTNLYNLFNGCRTLGSVSYSPLILNEWDLSNVENYDGMFGGCDNLWYIDIYNASCATYNILQDAYFATGLNYDPFINAPTCGGGNVQGSNRFILQATPYNMGYITYNNEYSTSFNDNNEEYFVFNDTIENFESSYGEISALSFNAGIENIISIPYIDTLTSLTINNLNIKYLDLSKTNLNNLIRLEIAYMNSLIHIDFSNWQTVSDDLRYNYQYVWESLDNLKTIKMLNCSQDAKDFVQQMLDGVSMFDTIIITEDNNNYITTDSSMSQSDASFGDSSQPLYSPVTDINDWGYSSFDGMGVQGLFQYNTHIYSVYNLPSLSATTRHWRMFDGCENLQYLDCSHYDFDWVNNDQDIASMFASCPNIAWLNLSSWDLTNAYNHTEMFNSCANLRWIFAYNCNDDTINKINEALQYGYDNGTINQTVEVYCDQNGN